MNKLTWETVLNKFGSCSGAFEHYAAHFPDGSVVEIETVVKKLREFGDDEDALWMALNCLNENGKKAYVFFMGGLSTPENRRHYMVVDGCKDAANDIGISRTASWIVEAVLSGARTDRQRRAIFNKAIDFVLKLLESDENCLEV